MSVQFGVSMPMIGDARALVELATTAEGAGWDGYFLWDHIQLDATARPVVHDPWVLLGAAAARTERVRLGTLVTPVPRRRPWKVAKEVTTLDHLSGGRAVLGVGLGFPPEIEYGAFGEPTDPRLHAAMLDEALPIIDSLLRGDPVAHSGEHYRVHAHLNPPALQRPRPPIWVAATFPHRRPIARARRWDGIFPISSDVGFLTPLALGELVKALDTPEGYDVVAILGPDMTAAELAAAGATWIIDGPEPGEPFAQTAARIGEGPPR